MELTSARATWFSLSFPPVQPSINHQQGPLFVQRKTRHTRGLLGSTQYRLTSFTKKEVNPHRKTKTNRLTSKQIATRFSNILFSGISIQASLFAWKYRLWMREVCRLHWHSLAITYIIQTEPSVEILCEHHAQRAQNDDRLSRERRRNEHRMNIEWAHTEHTRSEHWTANRKVKQNKQKQNTEKNKNLSIMSFVGRSMNLWFSRAIVFNIFLKTTGSKYCPVSFSFRNPIPRICWWKKHLVQRARLAQHHGALVPRLARPSLLDLTADLTPRRH